MGAAPAAQPPTHSPWDTIAGQQAGGPGAPGGDEEEPRSKRALVWVLSIIGVLAIIGIIVMIQLSGDREAPVETAAVPDVVGRTEQEARLAIAEEGFVYRPEQVADAEVPAGSVVSTDPEGGTDHPIGEPVTVFISGGPDMVQIPEMQNYTQQQARDALAQLGITDIVTATEEHPTVAEGSVIRTEPAANESVAPNTQVTLFLSSGLVELPDLTGQPEADARAKLTELSLIPEVTEEESDEAPGTVIRQTRQAGPVPQRSTVGLVVAIERAPEQVTVPDLYNLTEERAAERLGGSSLNVGNVTEEPSNDVAPGRVIRTDPPAGTAVDEGSAVSIVISSGPANQGGGGGGGGGGDGDD